MSSPPELPEAFSYSYLPENIHVLMTHTASKAALDACFKQLDLIFAQASLDQPLLLVSDVRYSGVPPISHLWVLSRQLFQKYPTHPVIYDAILYSQTGGFQAFVSVVNQLAKLFKARVQFFNDDERDKAIAWLLEVSEINKSL